MIGPGIILILLLCVILSSAKDLFYTIVSIYLL